MAVSVPAPEPGGVSTLLLESLRNAVQPPGLEDVPRGMASSGRLSTPDMLAPAARRQSGIFNDGTQNSCVIRWQRNACSTTAVPHQRWHQETLVCHRMAKKHLQDGGSGHRKGLCVTGEHPSKRGEDCLEYDGVVVPLRVLWVEVLLTWGGRGRSGGGGAGGMG